MIRNVDLVFINGLMDASTKELSWITLCMDRGHLNLKMEE
jgi:hypothetical protein